jgi:flagellin
MSRINTNIPALVSRHQLNRSQEGLRRTLERLSSGLRINRGSDDPAGLIVSERLRSEITGVGQAIDNSERAINIIATTEGALDEVASLLLDLKSLIVEAANRGAVSDDEIRANQLQVDSAVESITRIANATTFAGKHLLNGSLDYITSGVRNSALTSLSIQRAQFGTNSFIPVAIDVQVSQAAEKAQLQFVNSTISQDITIEVAGNDGVATLSFLAGTSAAKIMSGINIISDVTGVTSRLLSAGSPGNGIVFESTGFGSDAFVSIRALPGSNTFAVQDALGSTRDRDTGQDALAAINGTLSRGRGLELTLNTTTLNFVTTLDQNFGTGNTSFTVTGGGSLFQLGSEVDSNVQVNIGIQSVAASRLGNAVVGFLSEIVTGGTKSLVEGKFAASSDVVEEAIRQVATLRGRLGAFERNTLQTNINQLQITLENLTSSESVIRDADIAFETSELTRQQILVNAGTNVLALANSTPQSVLALLGG